MSIFFKTTLTQTQKEEMINKNIWSAECPISLDRLNLLQISYIDFDNNQKNDGAMIVHDVVANHVLEIFKTLYNYKFPIAKIKLINDYDGNDKKSMEDNNTSAFNCRKIENSESFSLHAYGLAIDINPEQNPFFTTNYKLDKTTIQISPPKGIDYINRLNLRPGMVENIVTSKETVIDIFKNHGFTIWGGEWNSPIDWHHFQVSREQAENIAQLPHQEGLNFFNHLTKIK